MTSGNEGGRPALLGGGPAHPGPWPTWPVHDAREREALLEVLESGKWWYGERFIEAMRAEGVPLSPGYPHPLFRNPLFQRKGEGPRYCPVSCPYYGGGVDYAVVACPNAERACREVAWLPQWALLGCEADMEAIITAARKIRSQAPALA